MTDIASADPRRSDEQPTAIAKTPGQPDMWVLVLVEALTFSSYFVVYMIYRTSNPQLYLRSQAQLSLEFGVVNTLMLLTSSWSMASCVQRSRERNHDAALRNVYLTIFLGVVFTVSKVYEWTLVSHRGLTFSTNEFFSFYYFLTGIHLIHLLMGFVVLGVVVHQLSSPVRRSQELIETGATYWHMIDFLWVIIFALVYVMR